MAVEPQELFFVEDPGGFAHVLQGEVLHQFFPGEDLLVAVGPAQAHQVVDQGLGQEALLPVGEDGSGAVAFGEFAPVRARIMGMWANSGSGAPRA